MPKKKKTATTSPSKKPTTPKKTATTTPTTATQGQDAPRVAAVHALLGGWSPISDVQRAAFASRVPDAICDALGARTKSDAVAGEALSWAKAIDATLRRAPASVRPYSAPRFCWLLENVAALLDARAAARADTIKATTTRQGADVVEATARAVRNDLLALLEELAGEAPADRAALDAARGDTLSRGSLAVSLGSLADLAAQWLARTDAASKALVAACGLAQGDVDRARAASVALVSASSSTALGGRVDARDTAAINRIEGRVLFEMRAAMAAFANANARDKTVPRLTPGAGTRAALASHGKAADAAPATPPAAPGGAPS